ncbi:ATP-binding cassette subfamily B protein [Olsenella profusa DSM 13989]|uniref:ABC transporter ATP-binding protein n=1 Tax=Olsenella profusa TaxID=138595 RepID=UPI0027830C1B|nr:ABC transporter ATP-binding protein [Olsenella profusa]MDP9859914.1 ATP-binding cassette subfamily B protein [Olsenella profusa DSM 13989]
MGSVLKSHFGRILLSVLMAVVGVGLGVLPYYGVGSIIVMMVEGQSEIQGYVPQIALVVCGFVGSVAFHEASTVMSHNLAFRVIEDERKRLADKLSRLSMGAVEGKSSGQWAQFMVETLDKLERPIAHVIPEVLANAIVPIVLVVIIFTLDWRIGVANLISLPVGLLFTLLMMSGYQEKSLRYQRAAKEMNTSIVEYVRGINVIKAFNKSASSYGKFRDAVNDNKNAMLDWYLSVCFAMTAAMETLPSTLLFVLPTVMFLYMQGSISVYMVVMGILLSYASYKPLIKVMSHTDIMANIGVIASEIRTVMGMPELEREPVALPVSSHDIVFSHVGFGYEKGKDVLQDLTFMAREGQLTAIVGYSGSGKSTVAKLIAGFWNVDSGQVAIGGAKLSDMPLSQNMDLVTYVSQENFLFRRSILENMRMAREDASIEEIQDACRRASCHDFIESLPNGYRTVLGDAGGTLSGGERQRVTIARALLKDSPIVLLDEATAYSDPDNEAEIQKSINALVKSKTVIMIAHRLSTIVHADKIVVMNHGRIEACGTHDELLEHSPTYRELWGAHTEEPSEKVVLSQ